MLTRLYCWLFGHKFWTKVYSKRKTDTRSYVIDPPLLFYRYEKQPFCLRCESEATSDPSPSKSIEETTP